MEVLKRKDWISSTSSRIPRQSWWMHKTMEVYWNNETYMLKSLHRGIRGARMNYHITLQSPYVFRKVQADQQIKRKQDLDSPT